MSSPQYHTAVALSLGMKGNPGPLVWKCWDLSEITGTSLWALHHIKQNVLSLQPFITWPLQQSERNLPQTPAVSLHRETHVLVMKQN